ncbi:MULTISPECIES: hypothetical protein [Phyllobacterium]|jgi:hypothetical protein|nr:hypothetical protein [Phyllobacterium calauticae]MBZ3695497.1 hypothetical protein [Phyllobacterium calauticae]
MKSLNLLFAAAVISAGSFALPLNAFADANDNGNGGPGSRGDYRLEVRPLDKSLAPIGNAPLTTAELENYQRGADASKASVKSVSK